MSNTTSSFEIIDEITHRVADLIDSGGEKTTNTMKEIITGVTADYSQNITDAVRSNIPKINGIIKEKHVYNKLVNMGYDIKDPQKTFNIKIKLHDINLIICGKVDGILYENGAAKAIVEIKNRQKGFFIPNYDIDQLATYVVISGLSQGILVQSYEDTLKIKTWSRQELQPYWDKLISSPILYKSLKTILRFKLNPNSSESVMFGYNHFLN